MKKLFIIALLTLSLAACGSEEVKLCGKLKTCASKNYSLMLPKECESVGSELADISAQYRGCSVAVVSLPLEQATVCADKKEFAAAMENLGYNLSVTDYEKEIINGLEAYRADYELEKTKITQITYVDGGNAYIATYARPSGVGGDTDEVFIKGLEAFEIKE